MRRLMEAQRALLSPQTYATSDAWIGSVFDVLRPLLDTDHLYYLQPAGPIQMVDHTSRSGPPGGRHVAPPAERENRTRGPSAGAPFPNGGDAPSGQDTLDGQNPPGSQWRAPNSQTDPGEDGAQLSVHCPSLSETFSRGINRHFVGFDKGFSVFRERYPTLLHRAARSVGVSAIHDAPLFDRKRRERLDLYQEVFRAPRIDRQMAISVPLDRGEALLIAGFPFEAPPDYDGTRHRMLELLLPAFETSIRLRSQVAAAWERLTDMVDALSEALIAFDADGTERYRNAAFRRLADVEPESDQLAEASHQLARDVRPALGPPSTAPDTRRSSGLSTTRMDLDLASGSYSLRAFMDASLLRDRCVLVIIERASALPPAGALQFRFGLTPREAEVASLMAQGYPDKEIAERLSISPHTARRHAERVLRKMPVSSRAGIALACMQA